jgi:hypothetical protein
MGMQRSSAVQQTIPGVIATTRRPTLTVTEMPMLGQLHVWWEAMQSDDLSVAHADSFPPTLTDFRLGVAQGERLFLLCLVNAQGAGALWLHDLLHRRDGAHFHRVGTFPDFSLYHRQPTEVVIYTLHAEDTRLAWELVTARAAH